jgi:hypothetical protein
MAYDAAHGQVVLFGGTDSTGYRNDTWVWNGMTWTQKTPANSPPLRSCQAMAYDAARREVVLFGGYDSDDATRDRNDTWVWDGTNWTQKTPVNRPPGYQCPVMVYDAAREQVVLLESYVDRKRQRKPSVPRMNLVMK